MSTPIEKAQLKSRWFSENEDKAWGERFFLVYTPIWLVILILIMVFDLSNKFTDVGALLLGLSIYLPVYIVPYIHHRVTHQEIKFYQTYWFKANIYLLILSLLGNYYDSEYFFDILGMIYNYPTISWEFDAYLVGSGAYGVPFIMYIYTPLYYMTYHTTAILVLRKFNTSKTFGKKWIIVCLVIAVSYFWAFMGTFGMANPLMANTFTYRDLNRMLTFGSWIYASIFIVSFPTFYYIDENQNKKWGMLKIIAAGLSVSMVTLFILDTWARIIGHI